MPSTGSKPASRATAPRSSKFACRRVTRSPIARQPRRALRVDGARVGVEPQQPAAGAGGLQDPAGVPSAADGRIDLEAARVRRESHDDLL